MKLEKRKSVNPFKSDEIKRPWGYYGLYADNEPSTSKILYIKKGEMLSMQYHFKRDQFYLILDDDFIIEYSDKPIEKNMINHPCEDTRVKYFENFIEKNIITVRAKEGDMFGFHRFVAHRAAYLGNKKYGRILDIAFGINDESDIVRLIDKYGRW